MFKRYLIVLSVLLVLTIAFLGLNYWNTMAAHARINEVFDRCPLDSPSPECESDIRIELDTRRSAHNAFDVALWTAAGLVSLMFVSVVVRWVIYGSRR